MITLVNADAIPAEPKPLARWVLWKYEERDGKKTKVPYRAADGRRAKVTDPRDFVPFGEAHAALLNGGDFDGVGLALLAGDGLVAFDFDHCLDKKGEIADPKVAAAVARLVSYTEVTPSGEGLRVLVYGKLPAGWRGLPGPLLPGHKDPVKYEVWDKGRYVTLTGNVFSDAPRTIEARQPEIEEVHAALLGKKSSKPRPEEAAPAEGTPRPGGLEAALKPKKFRAIYDSDSLEKDKALGYPSGSEADFALSRRFLLYGTKEQTEEWLRASPRAAYRKKFGRQDYMVGTLANASKGKATLTERAVEIAFRHELFHDDRKDSYARIGNQNVPIDSREFRRLLAETFREEQGRALNAEACKQAVVDADARAARRGKEYKLEVRFAQSGEGCWLDLCDSAGRAILVKPSGWEIVENPPILFRRYRHQDALPEPMRGGDLRGLLQFLNLRSVDDQLLILAWLVPLLVAGIPRPGIVLHGPQGSGKSTAAQILRRTIDPSVQAGQDLARKPAELAQILDHSAVPVFDNVSSINEWQSDMLCRTVTGESFSKRGLYTNDDDFMFNFRRSLIITGINVPTCAPDLLDRLILFELEAPPRRLEESVLFREFDEARPAIFGGLLDTLAAAAAWRATNKLSQLPRMADFASWGAAASEALGYGAERFLETYARNIERQNEEVASSDSVASAILGLPEADWEGTMADLKLRLDGANPDAAKSKSWPADAARLGKRINRLIPTLASLGVKIERPPGKAPRRIQLSFEGRKNEF